MTTKKNKGTRKVGYIKIPGHFFKNVEFKIEFDWAAYDELRRHNMMECFFKAVKKPKVKKIAHFLPLPAKKKR